MSNLNIPARLHKFASIDPTTPIPLGTDRSGNTINLDYPTLGNGHILINGASGSGKSHRILHLIDEMFGRGITVHVLEFHPNFSYEHFQKAGATRYITPESLEFFDFQYNIGDAAINPLKFLDTSPEGGGVYLAIQEMITTVKLWRSSLGEKQTGYLSRILRDVYQEKGIDADDPVTWVNADYPTLEDVAAHIKTVIRSMRTGLSTDIFKEMERNRRKFRSKKRELTHGQGDTNDNDKLQKELEQVAAELKDQAFEMINSELDSNDTIYYSDWDKGSLYSLLDIIDSMIESQLFTKQSVAPKPGKINVFQMFKNVDNHQRVLTHLLTHRLYTASILTCKSHNPDMPDTVVIGDEGRYLREAAKDPMSPVNKILGGSRKFGMAMIVGVQGPHQVTRDMADNFGTKLVLYIDSSAEKDAQKVFDLGKAQIKKLKPKHNFWHIAPSGTNLLVGT